MPPEAVEPPTLAGLAEADFPPPMAV